MGDCKLFAINALHPQTKRYCIYPSLKINKKRFSCLFVVCCLFVCLLFVVNKRPLRRRSSVIIGFYLDDTACWEKAIGLETGVIPDKNITASSYIESSPPSAARLGSHVGWCPLTSTNAFLQVDLGVAYYVCAVATQGHSEGNFSYVTHYAIQLSLNGTHWTEYEKVKAKLAVQNIFAYGVYMMNFRYENGVKQDHITLEPPYPLLGL